MKSIFDGIKISHIVTAVPKQTLDLKSLNKFFPQNIEQIIQQTGVEKVHIAPKGLCTSDLSEVAANFAFQNFCINPNTIDALVFVSQTPDYIFPATSVILQKKLGLNQNIVAFDINYGCSGYIYGLYQASLLLNTENINRVLLLAGDTLTKYIHPKDRSLRFIIGDASSATIIEKCLSNRMHFILKTDGSGYQNVIIPAGGCRNPSSKKTKQATLKEFNNFRSDENFFMNGLEVMNFALKEVPIILNEIIEYVGWSKEKVGFYGLHQANKFVLEYVGKKAKIKPELIPISVRNFGNTSVTSIPLMLTDQHESLKLENRLKRGVLCGYGVGFSWGALALDLSDTKFAGPIEV